MAPTANRSLLIESCLHTAHICFSTFWKMVGRCCNHEVVCSVLQKLPFFGNGSSKENWLVGCKMAVNELEIDSWETILVKLRSTLPPHVTPVSNLTSGSKPEFEPTADVRTKRPMPSFLAWKTGQDRTGFSFDVGGFSEKTQQHHFPVPFEKLLISDCPLRSSLFGKPSG